MIFRRLLIALALCIACKPSSRQETKPGAVPQVNATVVSIRTTIGDQTTNHDVVIANGRARSTVEQDVWRLFDTNARTVTFVDDVEKTVRTETLPSLLQKRRTKMVAELPAHFPHGTIERGGKKTILGIPAEEKVIEAGGYKRQLWMGSSKAIPEELFAMMIASDTPSSPAAPMMRAVDEELLRAKGFPLVDRAEVALADKAHVIERTVTGIASRQVPEAMLAVPRGYRDVTPKPPPSKKAGAR